MPRYCKIFKYIAELVYLFESRGVDEMYIDLSILNLNQAKELLYAIGKKIYEM